MADRETLDKEPTSTPGMRAVISALGSGPQRRSYPDTAIGRRKFEDAKRLHRKRLYTRDTLKARAAGQPQRDAARKARLEEIRNRPRGPGGERLTAIEAGILKEGGAKALAAHRVERAESRARLDRQVEALKGKYPPPSKISRLPKSGEGLSLGDVQRIATAMKEGRVWRPGGRFSGTSDVSSVKGGGRFYIKEPPPKKKRQPRPYVEGGGDDTPESLARVEQEVATVRGSGGNPFPRTTMFQPEKKGGKTGGAAGSGNVAGPNALISRSKVLPQPGPRRTDARGNPIYPGRIDTAGGLPTGNTIFPGRVPGLRGTPGLSVNPGLVNLPGPQTGGTPQPAGTPQAQTQAPAPAQTQPLVNRMGAAQTQTQTPAPAQTQPAKSMGQRIFGPSNARGFPSSPAATPQTQTQTPAPAQTQPLVNRPAAAQTQAPLPPGSGARESPPGQYHPGPYTPDWSGTRRPWVGGGQRGPVTPSEQRFLEATDTLESQSMSGAAQGTFVSPSRPWSGKADPGRLAQILKLSSQYDEMLRAEQTGQQQSETHNLKAAKERFGLAESIFNQGLMAYGFNPDDPEPGKVEEFAATPLGQRARIMMTAELESLRGSSSSPLSVAFLTRYYRGLHPDKSNHEIEAIVKEFYLNPPPINQPVGKGQAAKEPAGNGKLY